MSDQAVAGAGSHWQARAGGVSGNTPPASLPLTYFGFALIGMVACGITLAIAARAAVTDPTDDMVVAAAHFGMLATLSMGILGALHQFTPVVTQSPLRSVALARATFVCWLFGAWLLPLGFALTNESIVEAGGAFAGTAVALVVVNLSKPLSSRRKGAPVVGLRISVAGFAATALYGLVYVADRRGSWFELNGHVVLAHAVVGLFAWLGLTYVSVAEKLFPMFFLAHIPGRKRAGMIAIISVAGGVALLSPGLLFGLWPLAWSGGVILAVGLGFHLFSLIRHVIHRRRKADLYLVFVLSSAGFLAAGVVLSVAAAIGGGSSSTLSAACVAAFAGWVLLAFLGHLHKVIPFVLWSKFRSNGIARNGAGGQLVFGDLYVGAAAAAAYALVASGTALVVAGLVMLQALLISFGGLLIALSALVMLSNFSLTPWRLWHKMSSDPTSR